MVYSSIVNNIGSQYTSCFLFASNWQLDLRKLATRSQLPLTLKLQEIIYNACIHVMQDLRCQIIQDISRHYALSRQLLVPFDCQYTRYFSFLKFWHIKVDGNLFCIERNLLNIILSSMNCHVRLFQISRTLNLVIYLYLLIIIL